MKKLTTPNYHFNYKPIKKNNMQKSNEITLPTIQQLVEENELSIKDNALMVILNSPPPKNWIKTHPITKGDYLPIERVEYILSRVFTKWWVEIKTVAVIANSVVVVVRLYVINPISNSTDFQDGIGAMAIQTDKDKGAMDWNFAKADGVMKASPSAESYAIKDAAEKFGKLFGKDLNRKEIIDYSSLLKLNDLSNSIDVEDLQFQFENKKENLTIEEVINIERILKNKETQSYKKVLIILNKK